jgi:hypothetical protein
MRIVLLLSLVALPVHLSAQTPPPATQAPAPTTQKPAAPPAAPKPRPAQRTALVVTVTDPSGATIPGVRVDMMGAADRTGETDESGQLRFANVRAGTYRVRFSGEGLIPFERETIVRAGQTSELDVTLNRAPETKQPEPVAPAPAPAAAPAPGPPGEAKLLSILDLLEKDFIGRQPRKESLLGCSGNMRTTMIQLNEPQPERLYESAESAYYVLGGEGAIRLGGRESSLVTGSFVIVPRGSAHGFTRKGRRPLILLAVLSGEPCQTN